MKKSTKERSALGSRVDNALLVELEQLSADPATPPEVALRALVILAAVSGMSDPAIAKQLGLSGRAVFDIRHRFQDGGVSALLTPHRPPRRSLAAGIVNGIVDRAVSEAPLFGLRWTLERLSAAFRVSRTSVHKVLKSRGVKLHKERRMLEDFNIHDDASHFRGVRAIAGFLSMGDVRCLALAISEPDEAEVYAADVPQPGVEALLDQMAKLDDDQLRGFNRSMNEVLCVFLDCLSEAVPSECAIRLVFQGGWEPVTAALIETVRHDCRFDLSRRPLRLPWSDFLELWFRRISECGGQLHFAEHFATELAKYNSSDENRPFGRFVRHNALCSALRG